MAGEETNAEIDGDRGWQKRNCGWSRRGQAEVTLSIF